MALIFQKTVGPTVPENVLILAVREIFIQPFQADGWTDLRVGWFLSLTDETADDTITTLADTITQTPPQGLPIRDYVTIGLTDRATGTTFCGFSNVGSNYRGQNDYQGDSSLVSSDIGTGIGTNYWRPKNSASNNFSLTIIDGGMSRLRSGDGSQIHFAQNTGGAGGYATLLTLRFQRPNAGPNAKEITMSVKRATAGGHSADILFNNDPSKTILEANLEGFPTTVQTLGPVTLSHAPDTFFVYWPFSHSRLRIHAMGLLKAR